MDEKARYCRQCGTSNPPDAAFCGNCGTRFSELEPKPPVVPPAYVPTQAPTQPVGPPAYVRTQPVSPAAKRRTSRQTYLILGAIVVAAILVGAVLASMLIIKTETSLSIVGSDPITVSLPLAGQSNVTATLTTTGKDSKQISGKTIKWFVNGEAAGQSSTNANGVASLSLNDVKPALALGKNYTVRAEFAGETGLGSSYKESGDTSTLTTNMYKSDFTSNAYNETVGLVQSGSFPSMSNSARFSGTYLVFDQCSTSHYTWKDNVPYSVTNPSSTVFFVKTTATERLFQYKNNATGVLGGWGYRARFDIYAIKYPEKTLIGMTSITSEPPATITGPHYEGVTGDASDWQNWITDRVTLAASGSVASLPSMASLSVGDIATGSYALSLVSVAEPLKAKSVAVTSSLGTLDSWRLQKLSV